MTAAILDCRQKPLMQLGGNRLNGHAVFSYRVSGVLIRDGKILLQHPIGSPDYAFPEDMCAVAKPNSAGWQFPCERRTG